MKLVVAWQMAPFSLRASELLTLHIEILKGGTQTCYVNQTGIHDLLAVAVRWNVTRRV